MRATVLPARLKGGGGENGGGGGKNNREQKRFKNALAVLPHLSISFR